jgi:hypothetical protein
MLQRASQTSSPLSAKWILICMNTSRLRYRAILDSETLESVLFKRTSIIPVVYVL